MQSFMANMALLKSTTFNTLDSRRLIKKNLAILDKIVRSYNIEIVEFGSRSIRQN